MAVESALGKGQSTREKNGWYKTEEAQKTLSQLQQGEPVQLTWVDNWFWKIYVSKSKRFENLNRTENQLD